MGMKQCPLCKKMVPELLYDMHVATDELAIERMRKDFPGWAMEDGVCQPCLDRYMQPTA